MTTPSQSIGNGGDVRHPRKLSRSRKLAFIFILGALSFLPAVAAAEIYVRLTSPYGYVTPALLRSWRPLYGPSLFARHVFPLQEHTVFDEHGQELYTINTLGYRGPLFAPRKPPSTIRIMIYGGSSVFDHDNHGLRDWPHRVEVKLRESGYSNVEVINAGIPGHAAYDAVGRLFAEGHLFNPDYVVLYDQWNEIKNFRSDQSLLRLAEPLTESELDSPLYTYQNRLDRWLCEISQLYVRLRERYYTYDYRIGHEGVIPQGSYSSTLSETPLRQYRMDVQTFVDVARNAGAVPVLATEARLVARNNTADDDKRLNREMVLLTHDALNQAFEETDHTLAEVASQKDAAFIDVSNKVSGRKEFFLDAVHLTDKGADAVSNIVASSLATLLKEGSRGRSHTGVDNSGNYRSGQPSRIH